MRQLFMTHHVHILCKRPGTCRNFIAPTESFLTLSAVVETKTSYWRTRLGVLENRKHQPSCVSRCDDVTTHACFSHWKALKPNLLSFLPVTEIMQRYQIECWRTSMHFSTPWRHYAQVLHPLEGLEREDIEMVAVPKLIMVSSKDQSKG